MATATLSPEVQETARAVEEFISSGATLKDVRGLSDQEMDAIYAMAYNFYNHGKFEKAEQAFKFLTYYDHLEKKYLLGLAACRQMSGNYAGAVDTYGVATIMDPEDPTGSLHAAECLIAMKDTERAIQACYTALDICGTVPEMADHVKKAQYLLNLIQGNGAEEDKHGNHQ